jgi:hypothetical protein
MDATVMWGFVLIGAGAVVAGVLGLALHGIDRLAAVLPLVIGAGVGVAALAIGTHNTTSTTDAESAFLVASALGFIAVVVSSAALWLTATKRSAPPASPDQV